MITRAERFIICLLIGVIAANWFAVTLFELGGSQLFDGLASRLCLTVFNAVGLGAWWGSYVLE